jgi:nitroimidazol reductase NimA-like FMN-containing flavoprotein (pyridoxamine 5'-phosphate oxidase superfamily)
MGAGRSGIDPRPGEATMRDIRELRETIAAILESQRLAVLATQGAAKPYGSLVAFAATSDLRHIIFATSRATRKYANLLKNPGVAMVIDTRTNQEADFADAAAVTALGDVDEIAGRQIEEFRGIYLRKHPTLQEFVESTTTALLRVKVETYNLVSRFQNVQELHLGA